MDGANSFPLLRLPDKNLKDVLRNMRTIELVCFSMVSQKTKDFTRELCIAGSSQLFIELTDWNEYNISNHDELSWMCSYKNKEVFLRDKVEHEVIRFSASWLDERRWLNHMVYIFHPSKNCVVSLDFRNMEVDASQVQIIKECLKGLNISQLDIYFTTEIKNAVTIIDTFPSVDELFLGGESNQQLGSTQSIALYHVLPQNFRELTLAVNVSLNDLLLTNCSFINVHSRQLTEQDINLFLKHWAVGLKPELEFFRCEKDSHIFNKNAILEGIAHEFAPIDRRFKVYDMRRRNRSQDGGIDIHLPQGIKATIAFDYGDTMSEICIAVHGTRYINFG
ncbi:F-box domain-containing protein [Caenorhabditis elegans]|uniref:F-box domain-containing protein n=1 Tax=Caenorhabditis elegans TaxID=6239 RepID=O44865_CAEEL|nr:F-box domain-containing protein [Caenorhabditis elegans]CCD72676.1 F-box domain-containing protein [Caenorhabditis elegans]|eukprot:NP_493995.1 F-box B protein [Caenorhabditis elegans]